MRNLLICWYSSAGPVDVRELRALLYRSSRTGLRQRTTFVHDKRLDTSRNGHYSECDSLGDCAADESRLDTGTSSCWNRLCCRQRQTADLGWPFTVSRTIIPTQCRTSYFALVLCYPHMPISKVWIHRLLFVCVCLFVCTVTGFSAEDKASGVKFCTAVHRRPRKGISHGPFLWTLLAQKSKIGQIEVR